MKIGPQKTLRSGCLEGKPLHPSDGCYYCEDRGAYYGALKMAEWKQQQMTEKAVEWLKEHCACSKEFLNAFTEAMYENN